MNVQRINNLDSSEPAGDRALNLLARVKAGSVAPASIRPSERRLLVAVMMGDGYSTAEIAEILKLCDRTVERDKQIIRREHAIERDPRLVGEMTGRLLSEAELSVQRIRKVSRDKGAPPAVRVDAEHRCYQIFSDLTQRLQGLGYLPTAAARLEAGITHSLAEPPSLIQMGTELKRLETIRQKALPQSDEIHQQLGEIQQHLERVSLDQKIQEVSSRLEGESQNEHSE